ncbi:flagellar assembly peptidoglycan hydrolase FlgJ [Noviherbaspirillum autotrophicum]|uniref:Peptidoglycan hydrolase FlgJ n=1 Tax=Noviherbaspirillum autotrophicum TaxID=709839 RepID=A0A0C2BVV0_9BURK|nr:flagellar assembly peptidoglycan hydrolase FlgJ [Noviherbaspirillum autotrophicum]KIF82156.1 flagellar rod assembly protein FlgJ [Noviherbaspirillum autotrophicum]
MVNRINPSDNLAIDTKGLDSLRRSAHDNAPEALKTAAKQFEALFMNMIMKSMREASPQDGMFDNEQSRMYTSMLDTQLSQNLSKRGLGLADMLVRQLSASVGGQAEATPSSYYKASSVQARQYAAWQPADLTAPADGSKSSGAQPAHVQAFQERLTVHAEEASRVSGIPAKFMLGQAALETGWGKKEILAADGSNSYNLFNIKAGSGWKGRVVEAVTTEYVDGVPQRRVEKFRAYDSYADSFRDYARLLRSNPRYENVLANVSDVSGFAQGLQRAGYATDPHYAAKLTQIISQIL